MAFKPVAVCETGEAPDVLYPSLDNMQRVMGEPLDGEWGEPFRATQLTQRRLKGNSWVTELSTNDIQFDVWITASRIVVYCKKFDKGGGWVGFDLGGLAVAAVGNIASHALAANRRKGKALTGHIRFPWISAVQFSTRQGFGSSESLVINWVDGTDPQRSACDLVLTLNKYQDANQLARLLTDRVIAYRYADGFGFDDDAERDKFEALRTSGRRPTPAKGMLGTYSIPTSWAVPRGLAKPPAALPSFPPGIAPPPKSAPVAVEAPPAQLAIAATPVATFSFCTQCGSPALGSRFCTECGSPLAA